MKKRIYIGYDSREDIAYQVLRESILDTASKLDTLDVIPLSLPELRTVGLYRRTWEYDNSYVGFDPVKVDTVDKKPFSTEFSFSRFLVPHLNLFKGHALFMDCDMLVRSDIQEVFEYATRGLPVYCVKHGHVPDKDRKMDDQVQTRYSRKNWSRLSPITHILLMF